MLARLLCLVGRHDWEPHPDFGPRFRVRRCLRCGRVEADFPAGVGYSRREHLEDGRAERFR